MLQRIAFLSIGLIFLTLVNVLAAHDGEIDHQKIGTNHPQLASRITLLLGQENATDSLWTAAEIDRWKQQAVRPHYKLINLRVLKLKNYRAFIRCEFESSIDDQLWCARLKSNQVPIITINYSRSGVDLMGLAAELIRLFPEHEKIIRDNLLKETGKSLDSPVQLFIASNPSKELLKD